MKKKSLALLIILPLITFSQNKKLDFGLIAGIAYSNYIDNMDLSMPTHVPATYNGKLGFQIGTYTNIRITNTISIQPELLFSKIGSNATIDFKDLNNFYTNQDTVVFQVTKADINEFNILIPILLNISLNKFFLQIGPQFGYTIKRDISYTDAPINSQYILKNGDSEKFEIAANVGFGYNISPRYNANIRYGYGINEKQNLHSSIFYFGLAYQL